MAEQEDAHDTSCESGCFHIEFLTEKLNRVFGNSNMSKDAGLLRKYSRKLRIASLLMSQRH
ncbi:hypothetical protein NBRC116587_36970 [Pseudoteredinibacter isoporae]